jgi:hypothetical protein
MRNSFVWSGVKAKSVDVWLSFSDKFARVALTILLSIAIGLCLTSFAQKSYLLVIAQDVPQEILGQNIGDGVQMLDVDGEGNIPSWFSSTLLLLCSILLSAITSARKRDYDSYTSYWRGLSIIFLFLSLDEAVSIHERFVEPLRSSWDTNGLFYFAWVIPWGAFVVAFSCLYIKFLINLPRETRYLFIAAGVLYISGAIGMKLLQGLQVSNTHNERNLLYFATTTVEELLEMSGTILFLYALMRYTRLSK